MGGMGDDSTAPPETTLAADPGGPGVAAAADALRAARANLASLRQNGAPQAEIDSAAAAVQSRETDYANAVAAGLNPNTSSSSNDDDDEGLSDAVIAIIVAVILVVLAALVATGLYLKAKKDGGGSSGRQGNPSFENPLYAQSMDPMNEDARPGHRQRVDSFA